MSGDSKQTDCPLSNVRSLRSLIARPKNTQVGRGLCRSQVVPSMTLDTQQVDGLDDGDRERHEQEQDKAHD
jgi:hypothetical protein